MNKKAFVLLESILYISFLILDLKHIDSTYIKYAGIILCFIYALTNRKKLISVAMLFTLISDLFLLVLNRHYELGLLSFIVVQILYSYFLGNINNTYFNRFLIIRIIVLLLGTLILYIIGNLSFINELVLIYFSNELINMVHAYVNKSTLLCIGLVLFVLCDICVGLHNINATNHIVALLMWFFYLPSQVLIALS